jgi:hypothetical protein
MADDRDIFRQSARKGAPPATRRTEKKRVAPDKGKTKKERQADALRRGKPTSYRLHPDLQPALEQAAWLNEVSRRDLVEFLLRAGLQLLDTDRIELPRQENAKPGGMPYRIDPQPPIPDTFLG